MLRVGVIGLGVGMHHARTAADGGGCELAVLCDCDEARLKEVARAFPGVRKTTRAEEVVSDEGIDLVVVAGFDDSHADQVVGALSNGKHVFVEKPMCLSRREAARIKEALRLSPGTRLSSNLALRSCPRFKAVRSAISNGEMGQVYSVEGDYLWGRVGKLVGGWRKDMDFYSIVHGAAIHLVDLIMWMTGEKPVAAMGLGNGIATRGSGLRYNDHAIFLLEYESGMTVKVSAHGGCVHPHFHRVAVYGTGKTFLNELPGGAWLESQSPDVPPRADVEAYPARENRSEIMGSFIQSVLDSDREPVVTEQDVFDCLAVCFAVEDSIRHGRKVEVAYD